MMMIPRHTFDKATLQDEHADLLEELPETIEIFSETPDRIGRMYNDVMPLFFLSNVFESSEASTVSHLELLGQTVAAILKIGSHPNERVSVRLGEVTFDAEVEFSGYNINPSTWLDGYFAAMIVDDDDTLDTLINTPIEVVKKGNVKGDDYQYDYVHFIQHLHRGESGQAANLLQAMNGIAADKVKNTLFDMALLIYGPQMDLWQAILEGNAGMFDEELPKALANHQKFWGRDQGWNQGGAPLRDDPSGLISLPITAIAGIALARGIPVNHSSDYMPEFLLRKQF